MVKIQNKKIKIFISLLLVLTACSTNSYVQRDYGVEYYFDRFYILKYNDTTERYNEYLGIYRSDPERISDIYSSDSLYIFISCLVKNDEMKVWINDTLYHEFYIEEAAYDDIFPAGLLIGADFGESKKLTFQINGGKKIDTYNYENLNFIFIKYDIFSNSIIVLHTNRMLSFI